MCFVFASRLPSDAVAARIASGEIDSHTWRPMVVSGVVSCSTSLSDSSPARCPFPSLLRTPPRSEMATTTTSAPLISDVVVWPVTTLNSGLSARATLSTLVEQLQRSREASFDALRLGIDDGHELVRNRAAFVNGESFHVDTSVRGPLSHQCSCSCPAKSDER